MLIEIIKALLMGIVEGVTEWLPISSTGHMILAEQLIQFEASDAFISMFRVVIQLGAIMAVVVLFWGKLWPFGLRHGRVISKAPVWSLWFKVAVATLPVLAISLITNMAAGIEKKKLSGDEVIAIADRRAQVLQDLVQGVVAKL